jgi:hypothetical protein
MALIVHRDPPTDLKRASLACGKNHAYLHQFVHRGTPRRLPEDARYALASHLGVDESVLRDEGLTGPPRDPHPNPPFSPRVGGGLVPGSPTETGGAADGDVVMVPELRTTNIPPGADPMVPPSDAVRWGFPAGWVVHGLKMQPRALRVITIDGDAMEPMFRSGDQLLIDTDSQAPSPPGVFVLFDGVALIPRLLELVPNSTPPILLVRSPGGRVRDLEVDPGEIRIMGRAVWHARRL